MGTEELRSAILREAETEASELLETARATALKTIESKRVALEEHHRRVLEQREQRLARDRAVAEASLKVELRNALLRRKQQLVEDVFSEAEQSVGSNASLYCSFLRWAIDQIPAGGSVRVACRAEDVDIVRDLLSSRSATNETAVEAMTGRTELGLTAVLGDSEVDLTLRSVCQSLREHTLVDVAADLFRIEA